MRSEKIDITAWLSDHSERKTLGIQSAPRVASSPSDCWASFTPSPMILRNHGLLAVGKSIPLAFSNLFNLQFACETQVLAMAGNAALTLPAAAVSEHTAKLAVAPDAPFGTEWPGLLRKLDRLDPSYRT